jgi:hypothetical protein
MRSLSEDAANRHSLVRGQRNLTPMIQSQAGGTSSWPLSNFQSKARFCRELPSLTAYGATCRECPGVVLERDSWEARQGNAWDDSA